MKALLVQYAEQVRSGPNGLFSRGDLERLNEHAADGASGAKLLRSLAVRSFVDVGSGGGVPGIPLALELPDVHAHLIESQGWKAEFLRTCARELGLESRVSVTTCRAEDAPGLIGRELLDCGTARAVARPWIVAEYLAPLVRVGGHLVLWTTQAHVDELAVSPAASQRLGLGAPYVEAVDTPLRDNAVLLVWPRIAPCAATIPRRDGVAARKPLA
ncbi:MAG: RsmG family class I SAM-dependent methyltransferase [Gaiellales bacterium]